MKKRPRKIGRIPPKPPPDVPPVLFRTFGRVDATLAKTVASEVQALCYDAPRRSRVPVDLALIDLGDREGFGIRTGYILLKAGRYLLSNGRIKR